jgi:NAD(P)-dependent dehydrogenase (short-subunit alcohol dehydrogenase family)
MRGCADAGSVAEMEAAVDAAIAHHGGLDVLVNNVGIAGPTAAVEDVTPEDLDATLRVDLASLFHAARRAIPALRAAGGGAIVNLSSAAARPQRKRPGRSDMVAGTAQTDDRLHDRLGVV